MSKSRALPMLDDKFDGSQPLKKRSITLSFNPLFKEHDKKHMISDKQSKTTIFYSKYSRIMKKQCLLKQIDKPAKCQQHLDQFLTLKKQLKSVNPEFPVKGSTKILMNKYKLIYRRPKLSHVSLTNKQQTLSQSASIPYYIYSSKNKHMRMKTGYDECQTISLQKRIVNYHKGNVKKYSQLSIKQICQSERGNGQQELSFVKNFTDQGRKFKRQEQLEIKFQQDEEILNAW